MKISKDYPVFMYRLEHEGHHGDLWYSPVTDAYCIVFKYSVDGPAKCTHEMKPGETRATAFLRFNRFAPIIADIRMIAGSEYPKT